MTPEDIRRIFFTAKHRDEKAVYVTDVIRCLKRSYFAYFKQKPMSSQAVIGQLLHKAFVATLRSKISGFYEAGFEIGLGNGWALRGRCDLLKDEGVYDFKFVRNIHSAKENESYYLQIKMYCYAFRVKKGYLVFVDRESFDIEIVEVQRDDSVAEKLLDDARYLAECIENRAVPLRASPRFSDECEYCDYVDECW
jgi:Domain of unknown function DUF83.